MAKENFSFPFFIDSYNLPQKHSKRLYSDTVVKNNSNHNPCCEIYQEISTKFQVKTSKLLPATKQTILFI